MFHLPTPNFLLWCYIYSTGHETRSCKGTSFARPSCPPKPKTIPVILGLINYLQPFLPGLASKTTFLREQVTNWDWNPYTNQVFHLELQYASQDHPTLLWLYLIPSPADWCQWIWPRHCLNPKWQAHCVCKQNTNWCGDQVCKHRERMSLHFFWPWKVSHLHL